MAAKRYALAARRVTADTTAGEVLAESSASSTGWSRVEYDLGRDTTVLTFRGPAVGLAAGGDDNGSRNQATDDGRGVRRVGAFVMDVSPGASATGSSAATGTTGEG